MPFSPNAKARMKPTKTISIDSEQGRAKYADIIAYLNWLRVRSKLMMSEQLAATIRDTNSYKRWKAKR